MKSKEALERLKNTLLAEGYYQDVLEDIANINYALEVLEVIKKKVLNIDMFYHTAQTLTIHEFNLIKEWLENE